MTEYGTMTVRGTCFDDIFAILIKNGYSVKLEAEPEHIGVFDLTTQKVKISYEKYDFNELLTKDEKLAYTE